jgi:hypothetical protein
MNIKLLSLTIAETVLELGEIPSGHLYAAVMGKCTLEEYNAALAILKRVGMIRESGHLLTWAHK